MCIVICTLLLSRPARGAWVEIIALGKLFVSVQSRPARGAWVEMRKSNNCGLSCRVAPRKGRVG